MASKKKLLQAAAGSAGGAALNVEDVFSTYLRSGTGAGTSFSVSNNIDLSGEGGLVWYKRRTGTAIDHVLVDSERGAGYVIESNTTDYSRNRGWFTSFNSDGFSGDGQGNTNDSGEDYASWTFRKAPKFFDVVTYTGTGVNRTISHNLGSTPGMIIVKRTDVATDWACYHRGLNGGTSPATKFIRLNLSSPESGNSGYWNNTEPTDSVFSVGSNAATNANGGSYVAYLFAHNDGDGEFGPDADQDIIKCGSYTGDGSTDGSNIVDLGFEPQWLLVKRRDGSANWILIDNMRGFVANTTQSSSGGDAPLVPDEAWDESANLYAWAAPTPSGFALENNFASFNAYSGNFIYIAIRRGPMAVPTSATDVFEIDTEGGTSPSPPAYTSGFPVDMGIYKTTTGSSSLITARLTQDRAMTASTSNAEFSSANMDFDFMDGWFNGSTVTSTRYSWMWKRAPNYFDVVAYTGNGTAGRTVSHNLGVAPELFAVKRRDTTGNWNVYFNTGNPSVNNGLGLLRFNTTDADLNGTTFWNSTHPTDSVFTVGSHSQVNASGGTYIAYLFGTVAGVSKVGSYTGNGTTQTINCGFSSGARFVLIKRTDSTGDWYVWDTARGIVASNDPHLSLNTTAAEVTTDDSIDPVSSGFAVNQVAATNINVSSASYIFYAVS